MDAMRGVAAEWESITSVIQNCFTECGFGIEDAVGTEEDDQDNSDWVELQGHVDCPSTSDKYLNVDQLILTTEDLSQRSFDIPDCEHLADEQEEEGEEMRPLSECLTRK
jgi:hypothetical protein